MPGHAPLCFFTIECMQHSVRIMTTCQTASLAASLPMPCRSVTYCSSARQKEDWRSHKAACASLAAAHSGRHQRPRAELNEVNGLGQWKLQMFQMYAGSRV